jgi:hypothetical protein
MQLSDESFWPQARIDFCLALLNASGQRAGSILTRESRRWIPDFVPRYLPTPGSLLSLSQGLISDLTAWANSRIGDQRVREHLGSIFRSASISSFYGDAKTRNLVNACRMVAALCLRRDPRASWLDVGQRMVRENILAVAPRSHEEPRNCRRCEFFLSMATVDLLPGSRASLGVSSRTRQCPWDPKRSHRLDGTCFPPEATLRRHSGADSSSSGGVRCRQESCPHRRPH